MKKTARAVIIQDGKLLVFFSLVFVMGLMAGCTKAVEGITITSENNVRTIKVPIHLLSSFLFPSLGCTQTTKQCRSTSLDFSPMWLPLLVTSAHGSVQSVHRYKASCLWIKFNSSLILG